jgi:hypothetical protein
MAQRCLLIILLAACLAGCARRDRVDAPPPAAASFVVAAEDYDAAFEVAQAELRRRLFELERVDAQAGVILTRPEAGAGLLTPWTIDRGGRLIEDTLNAQSRTVEVRFEPAESLARPPRGTPSALADPDLPTSPRRAEGSVVVSVRVLVSRRVTPTRRLEPTAIAMSSTPAAPRLSQRNLGGVYDLPRDLDAAASARFARAMDRRLREHLGRRDAGGDAADQGATGTHAKLAVQ